CTFTTRGAAGPARPAPFVHVPVTRRPVVSPDTVCGAVQVTGPLTGSAPDVVTVMALTYQPSVPAVPLVTATAAPGGVLSSFTVSGAASVTRPASFVHRPWNVTPVVSVVWC